MERPLTGWELRLVAALSDVDGPNAERVRESIPHLVVTGGCGCGCPSFHVRDSRFPEQPHELEHFSGAATDDGLLGFDLWIGPDGRPLSVDIDVFREDKLLAPDEIPDPSALTVNRAEPLPADIRRLLGEEPD